MAGFEDVKSVIPQESFISAADKLLGSQDDPNAKFEQIVTNAQVVAEQIGKVVTGELVVEPPLSEDQIGHYHTASRRIIALGQKASRSVRKASTSRRASLSGRSKKGAGSEAKG